MFEKSKEKDNEWVIKSNESNECYRLSWIDDVLSLTMLAGEKIIWKYALEPVDTISINISSGAERSSLEIDWFYADTFAGDLSQLSMATIHGTGIMGIQVKDDAVEEILVHEEYYTDENISISEYSLNRKDGFSLNFRRRYELGKQYAIYRIPYKNGEFVFYLEYTQ